MTEPAAPVIRDAQPDDAAACAALYAPYVLETGATFELEPPDDAELARRIAAAQRRHAWLVAERDGEVVGYAHGGTFRARPAYDWSCETSVYLRRDRRGAGTGRLLVEALLERLADRGMHRALALVALPNDPSIGLHEALGFRRVAHFERVGWKLGAWRDVVWLQRDLVAGDTPPAPLDS